MQHLGFSTTWLREYTRRNILLCTLLAFSVLNLESALGSTTAPSDAANYPLAGDLTEIEQDDAVIIAGQRYHLDKNVRIVNKAGNPAAIHELPLPVYVLFECSGEKNGIKPMEPVIISIKETEMPL